MRTKTKSLKADGKKQAKRSSFAKGIEQGLREAIAFMRGEGEGRVTEIEIPDKAPDYTPPEVIAIRKKLGMTQRSFARLMNVSLKSVESWEAGTKHPGSSTRRLIQLASDPQAMESMARFMGYSLVMMPPKSKSQSSSKCH
jgi:DNA-binding transcriptional regulator YiaG